jgi:sigma-B regulation protein RsbU (phosphoserine phosphatase)
MKSFLIGPTDMMVNGKRKWSILSQEDQVYSDAYRAIDPKVEISFDDSQEDPYRLVQRFKKQKSGSFEMPYQGVDSFWAFAAIFPDLHFVIVAPKSMVRGLSEEVGASFDSYTSGQTSISILAVCIVIIFVAGLALFFSRMNTRNLTSIVNGFRRLGQGDFRVRLAIRFNDERDLIVTTFNQIMPRLEDHLRMSRTLGLAKDVQRSLLPSNDPSFPGFDIAGTSLYCEETGGDYYDFIHIDDDRLAVVVGDVSGHGVSSALLMATARAFVMLRTSMPGPAASIINDVNKHLSLDTYDTGNFMTFFYCELAKSDRKVRWIRAGHDPALLYDPDTDAFDELKGDGLAFGLDYTFEYAQFQRTLTASQIILIGTDGIWEMQNEAGEMFGKKRLRAIIRSNRSATAKKITEAVAEALKEFRGGKQQEDDVTMVVIKAIA